MLARLALRAAVPRAAALTVAGFSGFSSCAPIRPISTPHCAPPGGHYSQAVVSPPGASLAFVSGMLPVTPDGEKLVDAPIEAQAAVALANLKAAVVAAGGDLDSIVKVTVYITDVELWPRFNATYSEFFGPCKPARAVVPVPTLHYGFAVEVECTAVVKST